MNLASLVYRIFLLNENKFYKMDNIYRKCDHFTTLYCRPKFYLKCIEMYISENKQQFNMYENCTTSISFWKYVCALCVWACVCIRFIWLADNFDVRFSYFNKFWSIKNLSIEFIWYKFFSLCGISIVQHSMILFLSFSHHFDRPCIYVISSYTLQYSSSFSHCSLEKFCVSPFCRSIALRFLSSYCLSPIPPQLLLLLLLLIVLVLVMLGLLLSYSSYSLS